MDGLVGTLSLKDLSLSGTLSRAGELSGDMNAATNAGGVISNTFFRGQSAYEVAVEHGFEGTEEEWLPSLKGETGDDGISVTHRWDGTTLQVTSASGTSSADLKGERGEQGPQGEQGIQGVQGRIGYSAYEVAVQHGFVGTEEEWIESLQQPAATSISPGIMKLYNETGENTDGAMTQRSITHAIIDSTAIGIPTDDLLEILT